MNTITEYNNGNLPGSDKNTSNLNSIEIPSISLPKGGGAIKGIDEKFSVNAANGTATFSFQLQFSQARGATPTISLSYNSGAGNGIFGLGWQAGIPSIKRYTDKEIPQYNDVIDSDTFIFSNTEDLVPAFKKRPDGSFEVDTNNEFIIDERDSSDGQFTIRYYTQRIEGDFARIERWMEKGSGAIKWKITNRENLTTLFGWTSNARIADPEEERKIFEWLPEFMFDDKGNCTRYFYKKEDGIGLNKNFLHNRNRVKKGKITYTNTYLAKVLYGNKTPFNNFGDAFPTESDFLFSTVLDYGPLFETDPPDTLNTWDFRPDPFSEYKAGFEIRTTRLCKRILFYHHFDEYNGLVRSLNFDYQTSKEGDFSFLTSLTQHGYIKKEDGGYAHKKLQPLEFEYQEQEWDREIRSILNTGENHSPFGMYNQEYQLTDLYNEGLSGILTERANNWYYTQNLGNGEFAPPKPVNPKPSFEGLGSKMHLVDLDGDGSKQLVSFKDQWAGYFELKGNEWQNFRAFRNLPNINFKDHNAKMMDLDGDGKPEFVVSEGNEFTWYPSRGRKGFKQAKRSGKAYDEETGPLIGSNATGNTIFFADMSGDGLTDIVKIRNGEVCYWPNQGNGLFGAKISMDNAPVFDHPESFNPRLIKLVDVDSSGTSDIIYLGKNKFSCWKNLCGNRFSTTPFEIDPIPEINQTTKVSVVDLLGNGVPCIVWSNPLAKDEHSLFKYIDLTKGKKPLMMVGYKNNLGKEVSIEYKPSTHYHLEDKKQGKPWKTKLHFPVHCISKTITTDKISGSQYVSEYKYHHGYYDHHEREFRGFGMVEKIDAETFEHWKKREASNIVEEPLHQEPVISKTWYHTGTFPGKDQILSQFKEDFWHAEMARQGFEVDTFEADLPDASLMEGPGLNAEILNRLSGQDWWEAFRACKGAQIRTEIFASDADQFGNTTAARKKALTPFLVTGQNYIIELVQPRGKNKHAVFVLKESESLTYNYERDPEDPRITHNLTIKSDAYGNALEQASVIYPRRQEDPALPGETRQEQCTTTIFYTENAFTNDVVSGASYRLRLPSEVKKYELKGVVKPNPYYQPADFQDILLDSKSVPAFYHEQNKPLAEGKAQRRIIEHTRFNYYKNNLSEALPLHQLESLALPFEKYQLAYTPELISDIFGTRVNAPILNEGKYTHNEGDHNWWIRSGASQYIESEETAEAAKSRFYVPISFMDPGQAKTRVKYYGNYWLVIEETEDVLGNTSSVSKFNFRTLAPQQMKDINGNLSEAISDELGFVKAFAVLGKGNQADDLTGLTEPTDEAETALIRDFFSSPDSIQLTDTGKRLLQHATSRFIYDVDAYRDHGKPVVVSNIKRETHYRKPEGNLNPESKVQIGFEYSNGLGEVVMKKVQAPPGKSGSALRWIGTGRIIKNNKGKAVKKYEPYFSETHQFEADKELVEAGVTPKMFYDPVGRLVKTVNPDETFIKVEFNAWKQVVWDENDTLLESSWYTNRTNRLIDAQLKAEGKDPGREKIAADKAAKHANTPNVFHLDTLGRPVLSIEHNKNQETQTDAFYHTRVQFDIQGNLLSTTDARGNTVIRYKYDMLGHKAWQNSMDAGQRWFLLNILSQPLRTWDERDHEFQYYYDSAHRPAETKVTGGDGSVPLDHVFSKIVYGESLLAPGRTNEADLQALNILGQSIKNYDTAGVVETPAFDLNEQPVSTTRKLFKKYKKVANWVEANLPHDLEAESYTRTTETDALGRIIRQTEPDGSVITFSYNETGLLAGESVLHSDKKVPTPYIQNIDYNEKGQKEKIIYGNKVFSRFYYDTQTFRLNRLESKRQNGAPLQDWRYTFDPVGNITHIEDKNIPTVFFNNQKITGVSEYTYDALYRLKEAKGRENTGKVNFGSCDNWNDQAFMREMQWGDPMAVRKYVQTYQYDSGGNILAMEHRAAGGNWTRTYEYETTNNRLKSTRIGENGHPVNYTNYKHHASHGFMLELPHLEQISWNFNEEVVRSSRQHCTGDNLPETTWYQYDGNGKRIRKITENQAATGQSPTKKEERIYLDGYELFKKHSGARAGFECETLSLMDSLSRREDGNDRRFIMIESRNDTEKPLVRYQLHNHLGSSTLELDGTEKANVISYEEYHPYGTTAYQARNKEIQCAAKRYRYTGMERDEETGLEYHGSRYYMPWLGRWLSCDPLFQHPPGKEHKPRSDLGFAKSKPPGIEPPAIFNRENRDQGEGKEQMHTSQAPKGEPPPRERASSGQEGLLVLENLNFYTYGDQNPIIYQDPTGEVPILQEWHEAYENADTGGKVGYGFLFIFAWLAHVIVNLVILVLSITLFNPGGLFGALDFSWGGLQSVGGLLIGIIFVLFGADVRPHWGMGAEVEAPAYFGDFRGFSLGPVSMGPEGFGRWDHEFGHTWQSRLLGPLYLFVIGIPSASGADWTEDWADDWAT